MNNMLFRTSMYKPAKKSQNVVTVAELNDMLSCKQEIFELNPYESEE